MVRSVTERIAQGQDYKRVLPNHLLWSCRKNYINTSSHQVSVIFPSPRLPFFFFNAASATVTFIDLCAALGSVNPSAPSLLKSAPSSPGTSERSLDPTQLVQLIKCLTSNKPGSSCFVLFLPPYLFTSLALMPSSFTGCHIQSKPLILPPILVQSFLRLFCFLCIFPRTFSYCPSPSLSSAQDRCCLLRFPMSRPLPHCTTVVVYLVFAFAWTCIGSSCHHLTFAVRV